MVLVFAMAALALIAGSVALLFVAFRRGQVRPTNGKQSACAKTSAQEAQNIRPPASRGAARMRKDQVHSGADDTNHKVGKGIHGTTAEAAHDAEIKAAAKREALRQQAKKQAAQRKAREAQREAALRLAEEKRQAEALNAATSVIQEVLSAVDCVVEANTRKKMEAFDAASTIVQEILCAVEDLTGMAADCDDVALDEEKAPATSKRNKAELKMEKNMQIAREIAEMRGNFCEEDENNFEASAPQQNDTKLTKTQLWLMEGLSSLTTPPLGSHGAASSCSHGAASNCSADESFAERALPSQPRRGNMHQEKRQASQLTAVEREILKCEKKLREIGKLRDRQSGGEELERKQIEKLARAEHITGKLEELRIAHDKEQEIIAEEVQRYLREEQERAEQAEREEAEARHLVQPPVQPPKVFRVVTRQTAPPGLTCDTPPCIGPPALSTGSHDTRTRTAIDATTFSTIDTRKPPDTRPVHISEPKAMALSEDRVVHESSNSFAPTLVSPPRILVRPQGSRQFGDSMASNCETIVKTQEQKRREYAAARARIFKQNAGRGYYGTGYNGNKNKGRGRGRLDHIVPEIGNNDFKSDPDYDRNRIQFLVPPCTISESESASNGSSGSETDSDYLEPYW